MPEITNFDQIPLRNLMNTISLYKNDPSNIQRAILDHLEKVTNGSLNFVDPTNPFIFLLEASCVNTAIAITESAIQLRSQYPILAQSESDLYKHMSDYDYINRFASPASATFHFMINYEELLGRMISAPQENCKKITIARNTKVTTSNIPFSLQYPIDIKQYPSGAIQVEYDAAVTTPLQTLSSNIIDFEIRTDGDSTKWLFFSVLLYQFDIDTVYYPIKESSAFSYTISFMDQFYYCRVLYKKNQNSAVWSDMKTTHADQIYDSLSPTAIINVVDGAATISIPPVYISNGLVDGSIRIDIYTTKGKLYANMSDYLLTAFSTELKAIDEINDYSIFTNHVASLAMLIYTDAIINGGSDGVSFLDLRDQVINNTLGAWQVPITENQLISQSTVLGFEINSHVDIITDRIFTATKALPSPSNVSIHSSAELTVGAFSISPDMLREQDNVKDNGARITLLSRCLYELQNGQFISYSLEAISALMQRNTYDLAEFANTKKFFYSPFHYVFDNSKNEFKLRAYYLDDPIAKNISQIANNKSIELSVNTSSYLLEKVENGFRLRILTKSDALYQAMHDSHLTVQIAYIPIGETTRAYVNGTLYAKNEGERIYEFLLNTNYDIDSEHHLLLTNFEMFNTEGINTKTPLEMNFELFYATDSLPISFTPIPETKLLGSFLLPSGSEVITQERITLCFGKALEQLWTQSRSIQIGNQYEVYSEDIPLRYREPVFAIDSTTGSSLSVEDNQIVYTQRHAAGETVYDEEGRIVIEHKKGDVILDQNGQPIGRNQGSIIQCVDILLIEGSYFFANNERFVGYAKELISTLVSWITVDLVAINSQLLEKTFIYFHPKISHGQITANVGDSTQLLVDAAQSFSIELYVPPAVHRDDKIRILLEEITYDVLKSFIFNQTLSISSLISDLKIAYGDSVTSIRVSGLGGAKNFETLSAIKASERFSLKKKLITQEDGTRIVREDITIKFISFEG